MNTLKGVNVIFFLLLMAGFNACRSQQIAAEELIISLERTPCFGPCEVYKIEVFASGVVRLNGISNVTVLGKHSSQVSKSMLTDVQEKFRRADFFSFKSKYTGKVSDLPTTYIYFKDGPNEKMIQDYYGAPAKLKELEKIIEDLVVALKWKKED